MSATGECACPCPDPTVVEIPGSPGENGEPGEDGQNAFTLTTEIFVVPAIDASVGIVVESTDWMSEGQNVYIEAAGYFEVVTIASTTAVTVKYLDYTGNDASTDSIPATSRVVPAGVQVSVTGITSFTDNTTGTAGNTLTAGVGVSIISFYVPAPALANGDVITTYVPGYKFKLLKFDARCNDPVTTGAKAATINLEINTTNVTGGVIALSGTYAQGAAQAGTSITADNTGSSSDSISIEASGVTTFVEGGFIFLLAIQNMDSADAFASLADKVNDLLTALAP